MVKFTALQSAKAVDFKTPKPQNEGRNEKRNYYEDAILELMRADPTITTANMVSASNLSRATVERTLKSLKSKGIIGREGSTKKGKWIIIK